MSDNWQIIIEKQAEKTLKRLPKNLKKRIEIAINYLAEDPFPVGHRKIVGQENMYRIRVGGWRISYAVYQGTLIILVVEVASRGSAYRKF